MRAAIDAELTAELVALSIGEMRQEQAVTQAVLADRLGIKQPGVSALERQDDMLLSTLRNVVQALGGELRLTVVVLRPRRGPVPAGPGRRRAWLTRPLLLARAR
jgi:hypothetical protein